MVAPDRMLPLVVVQKYVRLGPEVDCEPSSAAVLLPQLRFWPGPASATGTSADCCRLVVAVVVQPLDKSVTVRVYVPGEAASGWRVVSPEIRFGPAQANE